MFAFQGGRPFTVKMNHDDMALVREFAASQSERAFATLVERHVGLVHSAALRRVGQPHLAEEITQAVFILLARKVPSLRHQTILSGWLYRTTGFVAADALKQLRRRTHHEEDAYMQSTLDNAEIPVWKDLAPFLESAMDRLGERDRNALLLRYFEGKTLAEVGVALGVSEDAARVRVNRALEKLHQYFKDRGIVSTTAVLAEVVSANSVQPVRGGQRFNFNPRERSIENYGLDKIQNCRGGWRRANSLCWHSGDHPCGPPNPCAVDPVLKNNGTDRRTKRGVPAADRRHTGRNGAGVY
jgi:RNA polymerase sigma factor (sigma-70 family)